MQKSSKKTILEEANSWIESNQKVVLARVIQTWGSSPCPIGSKMIVNEKGDFLGSVSGGCVEANVINECIEFPAFQGMYLKKKIHLSNSHQLQLSS